MSANGGAVWFGRLALVVVVAVLVASLWVIGSPAEARRRRNDERRVEDLARLVTEVRREARLKGRLPQQGFAASLARGNDPLQDPATGGSYGYRPLDRASFEVSAVFESEGSGRAWYDEETRRFSVHSKGPARFVVPLRLDPK